MFVKLVIMTIWAEVLLIRLTLDSSCDNEVSQ